METRKHYAKYRGKPRGDSEVFTDKDGPYCLIPLTKGLSAKIDPEDFSVVSQFKWCAMSNGTEGVFYAARMAYPGKDENGKKQWLLILLHRFLMKATGGRQQPVDHRNRDPLDCRKKNLRVSTPVLNAQNRRVNSRNESGLKGAQKHRDPNKWCSRITVNGKVIFLGMFDSAEDAHQAYRKAATEFFGEYASD